MEGPVMLLVTIVFELPKSRHRKRNPVPQQLHMSKPDLDNVLKSIGDGAEGVCWANDSQICTVLMSKYWAPQGEPGRVVVEYGAL